MVSEARRGLLERQAALERIDALIEAVHGGTGGLLTVAGPAGIGKTVLLAQGAARARERGICVLAARGGVLERDFAYGVVRQLLEPLKAVADPSDQTVMPEAAARAAALLEPGGAQLELDSSAGSAFALIHGLYWLVVQRAESGPILLCVDDAQWADAASLRWLLFLARRMGGLRLGVVLAWRSGEADSPDELLHALSLEPDAAFLEPAPLSEGAVATLLEDETGAPSTAMFTRACHELTGGNPFLLRELLIAMRERGLQGRDQDIDAIRSLTPGAVARSVLVRLSALSEDARALARAAAVLDTDAALPLAAAVAQIDADRASAAAHLLQRAEILVGPRFAHPLLRRAVYEGLTAEQRTASHRRAAEVLISAGESDRGAVHLLATEPAGDRWVVDQLHAAAATAMAHGAPDAAILLLQRALDEPSPSELQAGLLLERGRAAAATLSADAETLLRQALASATDPATAATSAYELSQVLQLQRRVDEGLALLDETADRIGAADPARGARLELASGLLTSYGPAGDFSDAEARLRALTERPGVPATLRFAADVSADWAAMCVEGKLPPARIARLVARMDKDLPLALEELGHAHTVTIYALMVLATAGELEATLDIAHVITDSARRRGDVLAELMMMACRGRLMWYMGRLDEAESEGRVALDAGIELGFPVLRGFAAATVAYAQAHRHELADAEGILGMFALDGIAADVTLIDVTLYGARAELRWAQGRPADALADVETYFAVYARGNGLPPFISVRTLRTRALLALGRADEARAWAREEVERFRVDAAPEALGMSLATLGLAESGRAGLSSLEEAVGVLRGSQRRLELARALVDLGSALRRAGQRVEARGPLREGLDLAARCGAAGLVGIAREELEATGARPRNVFRTGVDALTPSERRVAVMAAEGKTNTQIAQALFVAPKTVETHMRHVFQKLDVNSRGAIAEKLTSASSPAPQPPVRSPVTNRPAWGPSIDR